MSAGTSKVPLAGHLWHVVEAVAFIVMSLGGIWLSEVLHRRRSVGPQTFPSTDGDAVHPNGRATLAKSLLALVHLRLREDVGRRRVLLPLVGLGYFGAASVHFVVMPEHFGEATLYGIFFVFAASLQVVFGILMLGRPSRPLIAVGLVGNLAVIALWALTRTAGIPLGPDAARPETVGGLDVLATGFELLIVAGSALLLWQRQIRPALRLSSWAPAIWVLAAASAVAIAITTVVAPPS